MANTVRSTSPEGNAAHREQATFPPSLNRTPRRCNTAAPLAGATPMISLSRSTANLSVLAATPNEGGERTPSSSRLVEGVRAANPHDVLQRVSEDGAVAVGSAHIGVLAERSEAGPSPEAKQQMEAMKAHRDALRERVKELEGKLKELQAQLHDEANKSWPFRSNDRIAELSAEIQRVSLEMKQLQQQMKDAQEEIEKLLKELQDASSGAPDKQSFEAQRYSESPLFLGLPYEVFRKAYVREEID